jgi:UDP-N-acetylglucosamine 2-epimerase
LSPEDFLRLLIGAKCIVGNSSVSIREATFLGVPAVNIGNRQKGRDRGPNVIDTGYSAQKILEAIKKHLNNGRYPSSKLYGDGRAGERIADILATVPLEIDKHLMY